MGRRLGSKNKSVKGKIFHADQHWTIKNLAKAFNVRLVDLQYYIEEEGMRPHDALKEAQEAKEAHHYERVNTQHYTYNGETMCLKHHAIAAGVGYKGLRYHVIKKGRLIEKAIAILKKRRS